MLILKKGHQPGVYVPLRALFLVLFSHMHKAGFLMMRLIYFLLFALLILKGKTVEIFRILSRIKFCVLHLL